MQTQPMFARISSSRAPPLDPILAFAGGASSTTILSCCRGALLAHLDLPSLLTLRAVCRDLRAAVAREPLEDADTDVAHCLAQWHACFPAARVANASGLARAGGARGAAAAPAAVPPRWACLRGRRELHMHGASAEERAEARRALPGVRVLGPLAGECVARLAHGPCPSLRSCASELFDPHVSALVLLDCGRLLVSAGSVHRQLGDSASAVHSCLRAWDAASGACVGAVEGQGRGAALAALPGGRVAAVGDSAGDAYASVWDAAARTRVCTLAEPCTSLAAWADAASAACPMAALTGAPHRSPLGPRHGPGGLLAVARNYDGSVRVYSAATGARVGVLPAAHERGAAVTALALLPGGCLATGCSATLRLWDLAALACTAALDNGGRVGALAALAGGLLASGSGAAVRLWRAGGGSAALAAELRGHAGAVAALAALPRGLLASGSADATVRVWSVGARACVAVLRGHPGEVCALAALPGGRLACGSRRSLAQAGGDCSEILVWELRAC